jgi:hypothetical protein
MTQALLLPLMLYAACGLALSLLVHVLSFFGIQFGGNTLFFGLHIGIFPLWIPVVLIAQKMMGAGTSRKDFWKIALSGCPPWMKYMTYGFFIYAFVNFAIFMLIVSAHPPPKGATQPPAEVLHGFSGHWMAFYSAGLAILTTAYRRGLSNLQRKCPFGHEIGWNDKFCPTCGAAVAPPPELN